MDILCYLLVLCSIFPFVYSSIRVTAQLNSEALLYCLFDGDDGSTVRWKGKKNGFLSYGSTVISHHGQITIEKPAPNEWNLRIIRVSASFADDYTCQTDKGVVIRQYTLIIETAPRIDEGASSPTHVKVSESETAEMTCVATGEPEPTIQWFREGNQTPIGVNGPKLIIRNVDWYATDVYLCRATNKLGMVERSIKLTVNFPTRVEAMNPVVYAARGSIVVMSCMVKSFGDTKAIWYDKNDQPITSSSWKYIIYEVRASDGIPVLYTNLIIKKAILNDLDYGTYTCKGLGDTDEDKATVDLKRIEDKPEDEPQHVISYN